MKEILRWQKKVQMLPMVKHTFLSPTRQKCEFSGGFSATVDACLSAAKPAGTVVIVGMGADRVDGFNTSIMSTKELVVKSIFRYRNLYPTAINAIAGGLIDVGSIVSHRFTFDDTIEAFSTCTKDIRNVVKGVIEY